MKVAATGQSPEGIIRRRHMAEYQTIRAGAGARTAQIDEGLRAHMNKVYGTMSVGMLITALAAWAISGLATTGVPTVDPQSERSSTIA